MSSFIHSLKYFSRNDCLNALEEHIGIFSIGGRIITSLRFADDIDALAEEEQELEAQLKVSTKPVQGIKWR